MAYANGNCDIILMHVSQKYIHTRGKAHWIILNDK